VTLEEEARRGADAKQVLEHPIYKEAIAETEAALVRALKASAVGDESTHHRLAIALQLLGQVTKHIETIAQTGEMAEFQLKKESMKDRVKRAFR
jgi:hypothetical protein